ncbi:hypothetical protein D3C72_944750 [compost metagenome]
MQYVANDRNGEDELVGVVPYLLGAAPGAHIEEHCQDYATKDDIPPILHEAGDGNDESGEEWKLGPEALEDLLELGDDEQQQYGGHYDGHQDDHGGIEHGLLDLGFEHLTLLAVGGNPVVDGLQCARLLPRLHQIAVERIEVAGVAAQRLRQRGAGFHIGGDLTDEFAHRRFFVAAGDDLQALHQRHTGGEHGGDLAGDDGDVHRLDPGTTFGKQSLALLADLGDIDALLAQLRLDGVDVVGLEFTGNLLPLAIESMPAEGEDLFGRVTFLR